MSNLTFIIVKSIIHHLQLQQLLNLFLSQYTSQPIVFYRAFSQLMLSQANKDINFPNNLYQFRHCQPHKNLEVLIAILEIYYIFMQVTNYINLHKSATLVPIVLRGLPTTFCIFVTTLNVTNQQPSFKQLVNLLQQEESFQEMPHEEDHTMVSTQHGKNMANKISLRIRLPITEALHELRKERSWVQKLFVQLFHTRITNTSEEDHLLNIMVNGSTNSYSNNKKEMLPILENLRI